MKPTDILPDDASLPGLAAIRVLGLGRAVPELELGDQPVELKLVGYSRGLRATLEVRAGDRHFAVKCYARDSEAEAGLYEALACAGLASDGAEVQVPRLLAKEGTLTILVLSWLEGRSASDLILEGDGARAGELAARWLRRSASLDVRLRPVSAAGEVLSRTTHWAEALGAADAALGAQARGITERLSATVQDELSSRVINGRLYVRHVLDLGDAAGVIDWEHFGLGPLEIDAGMFLATLFRSGRHETKAVGAAQAEAAFRRGTAGLLDELRLAWYRAGALLSLAYHLLARNRGDWRIRAAAFLDEAERSLTTAAATRARLARATESDAQPVEDEESVLAADDFASEHAARLAASGRDGPLHPLSEVHFALMKVLWRAGEASVDDVLGKLDHSLSPSQVVTHLDSLEGRRLITRRTAGRWHVYRAAVDQAQVQRSFVEGFASRAEELFEGGVAELVCQLVRAGDVNGKDLARVIELLAAREREMGGGTP